MQVQITTEKLIKINHYPKDPSTNSHLKNIKTIPTLMDLYMVNMKTKINSQNKILMITYS
jgi:hypothetical protein